MSPLHLHSVFILQLFPTLQRSGRRQRERRRRLTMVSIQRGHGASIKQESSSVSSYFLVVLILVFFLIFGLAPTNDFLVASSTPITLDSATLQDLLALDPESRSMRIWKLRLKSECQQFLESIPTGTNITRAHLQHKAQLESEALQRISIPDSTTPSLVLEQVGGDDSPDHKYCKHVFIDLGTNRGDSIGCAVDASLDVCSALFVEKDPKILRAYRVSLEFPRPHLDVEDLRVKGSGSKGLSLLSLLQNYFARPGMESVCVYGMEGNPYFTEKLQKTERFIRSMRPRALNHLHIHTETIVTSKDGPTSLYIDQYSEKNHFWGSSVLQSMPDVQRTSRQNNGTMIKANVDGVSLSTLLQKTLHPFQPGSLASKQESGGSLLVKMDVEGAEYGVLKELAASPVLCEYIQKGNNATLIVEFHQHLIKDPKEKQAAVAGLKDAKEKLKNCGVKFQNLPNFWT